MVLPSASDNYYGPTYSQEVTVSRGFSKDLFVVVVPAFTFTEYVFELSKSSVAGHRIRDYQNIFQVLHFFFKDSFSPLICRIVFSSFYSPWIFCAVYPLLLGQLLLTHSFLCIAHACYIFCKVSYLRLSIVVSLSFLFPVPLP